MRFFLTTIGDEPWNHGALTTWHRVVAQDTVGRHHLAPTPASAERIVFVDLQQHPDDPYLAALRGHPLVRSQRAKVLVYDQRDRPVRTLPGVYVSADGRTSGSPHVVGGPYLQNHTDVPVSSVQPDLLWSFVGARTHRVRDRVLGLTDARSLVKDTTDVPIFSTEAKHRDDAKMARDRYRELLARSRFVLCPRGHGPSSFRLFETLAAGRVPVIVSDSWSPPPRVDWASCSIRIAESQVGAIPQRLRAEEHRWQELAGSAANTWRIHFAADRVWDHVAESLARLHVDTRARPWWLQRDVARMELARWRGRLTPG